MSRYHDTTDHLPVGTVVDYYSFFSDRRLWRGVVSATEGPATVTVDDNNLIKVEIDRLFVDLGTLNPGWTTFADVNRLRVVSSLEQLAEMADESQSNE